MLNLSSRHTTHNLVATLLDQKLAKGRTVVSLEELTRESGLTPLAVKRQLEHIGERIHRLPSRQTIYLQVPPEHRLRGAPPIAAWLGAYMERRELPYYLGMLSAAALHGSSQQAVQTTQVVVPVATRSMDIGRVHVDFYVKSSLASTPLTEIRGLPAHLAVSTPEATALDLIAFSSRIGGISRVAQVIRDMQPKMSVKGLRQALDAEQQTAVKQRLGYLLEVLGLPLLASVVEKALPSKLVPAMLQTHTAQRPQESVEVLPWRIIDNTELRRDIS